MNNSYFKAASILLALLAAPLVQAATDWSTQDYDLYPGDFNGDGKTDLLYIAKSADKVSGIAVSDSTGGPNSTYQSWSSNYLGINWSGSQYNAVVGDYNGDGKSDVLLQRTTAGDHYLLLANSQGQLTQIGQSIPNTCHGVSWSADKHKIFAGRFTGESNSFTGKRMWGLFFQSTSATGVSGVIKTRLPVSENDPSAGQIDGCGASQLDDELTNNELGFALSSGQANLFIGDFNGDNLDDLLVQGKPKFVMIDYEVAFPVPTYPANMNGIAYSLGGSNPFQLSAIYAWSRIDASGRDWSPLTYNLAVGYFDSDNISDVIFQARSSGQTSKWLASPGGLQGFGSNAASNLSSSINWSADGAKLVVGDFNGGVAQGGNAGVGVYLQSMSSSGTNAYVNDVTNSNATPASQGTVQTSNAQPVTSAGRTVGKFDVSPTGAATYAIPVWVPPGPRGIQPNLAITYNSQGGNGVMGPGWAIAGLSAIGRCQKTIAQDGVMDSIKLTDEDKFCLNGNRLRAVSGNYGADNSVYHTEIADFSRIIAHRPGATTVTNGPEWFEVWGKDGLIYEYGNSTDSRVLATNTNSVSQWLLTKVKDRNGNNYLVNYISGVGGTTGAKVPDKISYTPSSHGSTEYKYTVNFAYESDLPGGSEVGYVGGTSVMNTNLLTSVSVKYGASYIRRYSFAYQTSPSTMRARLSTIQECAGSTVTDCFTPTQITYKESETGVDFVSVQELNSVFPGDFNGDGRTDLLYFNSYWYIKLSAATGFGTPIQTDIGDDLILIDRFTGTQSDSIVTSGGNGNLRHIKYSAGAFISEDTNVSKTGYHPSQQYVFTSADVNGDGYADLVQQDAYSGYVYYRLNSGGNGNSYGQLQEASLEVYGEAHEIQSSVIGSASDGRHFDFNGDGRQDLLATMIPYGGSDSWSTILISQPGQNFLAINIEPDNVGFGDFNDDGCTDLLQKTYIGSSGK